MESTSVTVSFHAASYPPPNGKRRTALLPADCCQWTITLWITNGIPRGFNQTRSHVKIRPASAAPPVEAHSGDRLRNNKPRPICRTGPTSFVRHLFTNSVSTVLWGRSPFKWQMGGTFEHVMWSYRRPSRACVLMKPGSSPAPDTRSRTPKRGFKRCLRCGRSSQKGEDSKTSTSVS